MAQGLLEADEQWATHKKLIETKGRSIRAAVPKRFPYFHVEWAPGTCVCAIYETAATSDRQQTQPLNPHVLLTTTTTTQIQPPNNEWQGMATRT